MKCGRRSAAICDLGNPTFGMLGALNVEQEYLPKYFLGLMHGSLSLLQDFGFGRLDAEGLNFLNFSSNGRITKLFQRSMSSLI
jgi:hypothetical protein